MKKRSIGKEQKKMKKLSVVLILLGILFFFRIGSIEATSIEQIFTYSWAGQYSIDSYGQGRFTAWQYQPYTAFQSSLGTLNSVEIFLNISLSGATEGDTFRFRTSFVTGWSPANYQFSVDEWFYGIDESSNIDRTWSFSTDPWLAIWVDPLYGPDGNAYLQSYTYDASHTINATTRLVFDYTPIPEPSAPIPEPSTMLLLGSGLVGLAGFRRRFRKT